MTGEAVGQFVETLLRDRSLGEVVGGRALWLVPLIRSPGLVNDVIAILRHRPDLAIAAGNTLGRLAEPSTIIELEQILLDPGLPPEAKAGAAYALGAIGDPRVKGSLVSALRSPGQHPLVLDHVAEALGYLHEQAKDTVDDLCVLLNSESADVRFSALCALGNIDAIEALERAEELIDDNAIGKYGPVGEEAIRVCQGLRRHRQ